MQALISFVNQGLKGLPQKYQVELLEKYQKITKEDILEVLKTHFLPLFNSESSVAVVVTAPAKAESIAKSLENQGFDVTQRTLEVDPNELEEANEDADEDDDDESDSESETGR